MEAPSLQHWLNPYHSHDAPNWCPHQPLPRHSSAGLVAKRWLPSCAYPSRGVQRFDAWLSEAIKEAVSCRKFIRQLYPNKKKATKWKLSSWIFLRHFHAKHFHRTNRHRACSERLSTSGLVGHWQRPRHLHVRSQTVLPSSSPGKIRGTQEERTRRHGEALHNKKMVIKWYATVCKSSDTFLQQTLIVNS